MRKGRGLRSPLRSRQVDCPRCRLVPELGVLWGAEKLALQFQGSGAITLKLPQVP